MILNNAMREHVAKRSSPREQSCARSSKKDESAAVPTIVDYDNRTSRRGRNDFDLPLHLEFKGRRIRSKTAVRRSKQNVATNCAFLEGRHPRRPRPARRRALQTCARICDALVCRGVRSSRIPCHQRTAMARESGTTGTRQCGQLRRVCPWITVGRVGFLPPRLAERDCSPSLFQAWVDAVLGGRA